MLALVLLLGIFVFALLLLRCHPYCTTAAISMTYEQRDYPAFFKLLDYYEFQLHTCLAFREVR
jgi:hypothetical protein